MDAQLHLMEILGLDEARFEDWISKNGEKFAALVDTDPDLTNKLSERRLTEEEIMFLRDEFISDKVDTGDEDHEDEPFVRAA